MNTTTFLKLNHLDVLSKLPKKKETECKAEQLQNFVAQFKFGIFVSWIKAFALDY